MRPYNFVAVFQSLRAGAGQKSDHHVDSFLHRIGLFVCCWQALVHDNWSCCCGLPDRVLYFWQSKDWRSFSACFISLDELMEQALIKQILSSARGSFIYGGRWVGRYANCIKIYEVWGSAVVPSCLKISLFWHKIHNCWPKPLPKFRVKFYSTTESDSWYIENSLN